MIARSRPGRSVKNNRPSGANAIAQGMSRPDARIVTLSPAAGVRCRLPHPAIRTTAGSQNQGREEGQGRRALIRKREVEARGMKIEFLYWEDCPSHPEALARLRDVLREEGIVRIYDIFFDYEVLLETDAFFRTLITAPEFQRPMSTAEFHYRIGAYVRERERLLGARRRSILAAAHEFGVPIYTSSPGDSSIGMNVAALALTDNRLAFDVSADVNETAAIVLAAKTSGGKSGVLLIGGGSPKNFVLQTEPQIQEVLGISEKGHDYYLQITDARPDTGGLSGATPGEAVSWGKVDPAALPHTVVCYLDSTVALPILVAYAIANHAPRPPKRLYDRRDEMLRALAQRYREATTTTEERR